MNFQILENIYGNIYIFLIEMSSIAKHTSQIMLRA